MILLLFTASYPYEIGAEQTFLNNEIQHLKAAFERVVLVPRESVGLRLSLPDGVEVDESYSHLLRKNSLIALISAVFSSNFFSDIFSRPSILLHGNALRRLVKFVGKANITRQWVESWLKQSGLPSSDVIFYTYWFDDAAMGIGLAKKSHPNIRVVSRAHRYDLYEEGYDFAYWPCRHATLALLDRLFLVSENGLNYMVNRYPEFQHNYEISLLGVPPTGFSTMPSQDGVFRIVSCSRIVPVKRVDLLLEGIASAARLRPDIQIEWYHFGEGDTREGLQEHSNKTLPQNARAIFTGHITQQDLYDFYKGVPVDVFVNVSESEGTPVAIMEAISCGIPILATAVGGNVEIATKKNGLLLSSNPEPEEIAAALISIHDNVEDSAEKRKGSFEVWQEKYNAERNFQEFVLLLKQVRSA